jgi:hypothetical protein
MRPALRPILFPSYTDAERVFRAFQNAPTAARQALISTLIDALKAATTWDTFDMFHMEAAADRQAAKVNWRKPGFGDLIEVDGANLTHTADRGFTPNGSSSYLSTGVGPNALARYLQDSGHLGGYVNEAGNGDAVWGRASASTPNFINPRSTAGGTFQGRINGTSAISFAIASPLGHSEVVRRVSTTIILFRDGAEVANGASTSAARDSEALLIGRTGTTFSTCRIGCTHIGGQHSDQQVADTEDAILAYLTAVGGN